MTSLQKRYCFMDGRVTIYLSFTFITLYITIVVVWNCSLYSTSLFFRTAKTRKGAKALDRQKPRLVEDTKSVLFLRGTKCSDVVKALLRDLVGTP